MRIKGLALAATTVAAGVGGVLARERRCELRLGRDEPDEAGPGEALPDLELVVVDGELARADEVAALRDHLVARGITVDQATDGMLLADPWGTPVRVRS